MSDWVIEASDLTKVYRMGTVEVYALCGLTLTIERGGGFDGKPIADPFATQVLARLPVRNLVIGITPLRHISLSLPPADSVAPLPTANQPACEHKAASEEFQHAR